VFYPSLQNVLNGLSSQSSAMASLLGLGSGIDPSSPLGFLWSNLYANLVPWILMALGITLGASAISGDEEAGTLEYLLAKPVTRTQVVVARFAGLVTILVLVAVFSAVVLLAVAPLADLTKSMTTTAANGTTVTYPGLSVSDAAAGTFAAFAVGLGSAAISFLVGTATGRKSIATGISTAIAVGGYVLYTLSKVTGSFEWLTWLSPWRWYVRDAMLIHGLTASVLLPFGLAAVCLLAGWRLFLRRDLQS
jgi:ABC-2 type transport system permease protein